MSKVIELNARIHEVDLTICAIVDSNEFNVDAKFNREIILRQQIFESLWALWNHASLNRVTMSQMQISLKNIQEKFVIIAHLFRKRSRSRDVLKDIESTDADIIYVWYELIY